jgi:hypothetical protein
VSQNSVPRGLYNGFNKEIRFALSPQQIPLSPNQSPPQVINFSLPLNLPLTQPLLKTHDGTHSYDAAAQSSPESENPQPSKYGQAPH